MFKKLKDFFKEVYNDVLLVVKSHLCRYMFKKEAEELFTQIQENGSHRAKIDATIVQSHLQYLEGVSYNPLDFLVEVYDWLYDRKLDHEVMEDLIMIVLKAILERNLCKHGLDYWFNG